MTPRVARKGDKRAIPRHRKQVRTSSDRQERSIEKSERQKNKKQIKKDLKELP